MQFESFAASGSRSRNTDAVARFDASAAAKIELRFKVEAPRPPAMTRPLAPEFADLYKSGPRGSVAIGRGNDYAIWPAAADAKSDRRRQC